MTDTPVAAIPAGWYADSRSPGLMRWWDGTAWTEHTAAAAASVPNSALVLQRPLLPADRPVYGAFIWLIVLLPVVSLGLLFTWLPNFRYTTGAAGTPMIDPLSIYTPAYFTSLAAGWIGYGLSVFFAYRDVVWLRKQGVVRPFHWAWTFLYSPAYVIGRSVIVHRVAAPRGRAPMWAVIGVLVLSFIISIAWSVSLMTQMLSQLPSIGR